jgi:sortase (surface protein transpeptidase)
MTQQMQPVALKSTDEKASAHVSGPTTARARFFWTLGNLLIFAGLYVLLYVGGLYAQVEYHRMAARGDNDLPAPAMVVSPVENSAIPVSGGSAEATDESSFAVPVLATQGQITSKVPENQDAVVPGSTISRIVIPSIDVDAKVIEVGWDIVEQDGEEVAIWQVAEYAVGHHTGSANPGSGDNVVLAGHVGGFGKVFLDLYYVQPGDEVSLYSDGQQYRYIIEERLVLDEVGVPPEQQAANARYIEPTDSEMVTLVTCWPPSGAGRFHQRVVVRAVPYHQPEAPETQPDAVDPWTVR